MAFFPLAFVAWEYYNTGSLITSCFHIAKDFLWPVSVAAA